MRPAGYSGTIRHPIPETFAMAIRNYPPPDSGNIRQVITGHPPPLTFASTQLCSFTRYALPEHLKEELIALCRDCPCAKFVMYCDSNLKTI